MHFALLAVLLSLALSLATLLLGLRQGAAAGRSFKHAGLLFLLWSLPAGTLAAVAARGHDASWAVLILPFLAGVYTLLYFRRPKRLLRQTPVPLGAPALEARIRETAKGMGIHDLELARLPTGVQLGVHAFAANLSRPMVILADGLLHRLEPDEQHALACHELAHHSSGSLWWLLAPWPVGVALAYALLPWVAEPTVIGLAGALGIFGSRLWVSRPTELVCDRIGAQASDPSVLRRALSRLHALHPVPLDGWTGPLAYVLATHPPLPIRLEALGEGHPAARRHRAAHLLGSLVLLGSLTWMVASEVRLVWFALLSVAPALLLSLGARRVLKRNRGRMPLPALRRWFVPGLLAFLVVAISVILGTLRETLSPLWLLPTIAMEALFVWGAIRVRRARKLAGQLQEAVQRRDFDWVWSQWGIQGARIAREPDLANTVLVAGKMLGKPGVDRDLLELIPRFPLAGLNLSALSLFQDPDLAALAAESVVAVLPQDHGGYLALGRARLQQGRLQDAQECAEKARAVDDDPLIGVLEAWVHVRRRELAPAQGLLEGVDAERPGDPWALLVRAEFELARGHGEDAAGALDRLEQALAEIPVHGFAPAILELRERLPAEE